ncbi:hypothetical protein [Rhodohalobacter mucosus]|uniref:Uncharacterized protein n=1 Tax=Rhodohalobacter mucosus TaxID=2079485 RepID=A0A316TMN7_9BACT|nr:hypothetical protein [Rhodohalobacter mucosus]PWN05867.1 hypothetical protein DDZ15_11810 [Rhodohalobacter mucosus]
MYSYAVKIFGVTYRSVSKPAAFLLLAALLMPTCLHAHELAEFCSTDMAAHHSMNDSAQDSSHKGSDNNHHAPAPDEEQHCGSLAFCACSSDEAPRIDENLLIPSTVSAAMLPADPDFRLQPVTLSKNISPALSGPINGHAPPLWLLYDTYLL